MSLTGRPAIAYAKTTQLAAERVEIAALLSNLLDGDAVYCSNPRLHMITHLVPELHGDVATDRLRALRPTLGRDRIVKGLVAAAHAPAASAELAALAAALDALSARWDALLEGLAAPLTAAYREVRRRADPLAAGLDPVADLAAITGERDRFDLVVLPSLFLPPPQNGRHSVLVEGTAGAIGYLHYGFPLDQDPAQFGISRYWLLGGAWHYPVQRFLERHWPAIAAELRAMPDLEQAVTAALAEHRAAVAWPTVLAEHVAIALKCVLCARAGLPETVHRTFAQTQGLALFDWFREWARGAEPARFVAHLRQLPRTLAADRAALVAAAAAAHSGPSAINFALAARAHRPVLVVPDAWDAGLRDRIARRWSRITAELIAESAWRAAPDPAAAVIAFGEIGQGGLADDVLARRGLTLERSAEGGDVLVALLAAERARAPWRLAVAVHDRAVAGEFAAERVMGLFHATARFAGHRFVGGEA